MVATAALAPKSLLAAQAAPAPKVTPSRKRRLALRHLHTGETVDIVYSTANRYDPAALGKLNRFLRDHRDGSVHEIDPVVLDFLYDLSRRLQVTGPIDIVCGYRSQRSNALLRARSSGVAKRSLHLEGKALDIRVPGRSVKSVARAALALNRGGVGRYSKSNFVHIDSGRVRTWGA
jgi:uncharacterized protein YcbK (DUF882 family)